MAAEPLPDREHDCVIHLWPVAKTCFVCPHHQDLVSPGGVIEGSWCSIWDQPIDSEMYEAEGCSLFEVDPEKVTPREARR